MKFVIPDSNSTRGANFFLLKTIRSFPEWFYDGVEIEAAYGALHSCAFDGGRLTKDIPLDSSEIDALLKDYNSFGVQYRFVFTNLILKEENLLDAWGNLQLEKSKEYNVGVIAASDKLINYIKTKYPKIDIVSSVTKKIFTEEETKELLKDDTYKYVVINTIYNKKLSQMIEKSLRPKCEILINDCCPPRCPYHQECYLNNSKLALGIEPSFRGCKNTKRNNFQASNLLEARKFMFSLGEQLTREEVEKLSNDGFGIFKIEGRYRDPLLVLSWYMDYMVKHEKKEDFLYSYLTTRRP